MAFSPPPTPSLRRKRNFAEVNLGESMLPRPAKAQRTYFGIDIHHLLEEAQAEDSIPKEAYDIPTPPPEPSISNKGAMLWTEKYRARKFTDLIGDERTHRSVMHWLKRWDQIVFPGSYRPHKQKTKASGEPFEEKPHRKLLLLTGPPGLGKTTLAHVCAKQAGYEVQEINASDERSSSVVTGRIKTMVGTENVKGVDTTTVNGKVRKAGKPVCVIVDEVDGVVGGGGGGGGEGGFIKALIDLIMLDQRNSALGSLQQAPVRKKKGDRFRLQRPLILICNDIYHPALRLLRQSSHAEVIHVRKPQIQTITTRMHDIFAKEGVPCEGDGVRRLCEAAWGVSNRKEDRGGNGAGEGDMRGIMVVCEWVAAKLRSERHVTGAAKLTRRWVEDNILRDLSHGGGAVRGMGRGGPKDIVDRVFREGAGFPKSSANMPAPSNLRQDITSTVKGVAEGLKRTATDRLRELVDTHGDTDRIMSDCFASYPDHPFQDDTIMSKPDAAYEWLHFHDRLSKLVHTSSEWELAPYLSSPVLAFHHLFASPTRAQYANNPNNAYGKNEDTAADPTEEQPHPFAGPQASWAAHEATKHNESLLQSLQTALSLDLTRLFSSTTDIATDLLPYLLRMLTPNVTPVIVGGSGSDKSTASVRKSSEQTLVARAVVAMMATGVRFERTQVTSDGPAEGMGGWQQTAQWIYRMEPSIDVLGEFSATGRMAVGEAGGKGKQRFAVRQVLEQEWRKEEARRAEKARQARFTGGIPPGGNAGADIAMSTRDDDGLPEKGNAVKVRAADTTTKRDFFGRALAPPVLGAEETAAARTRRVKQERKEEGRVWVSFHEGYSNAVRKGIGLRELMGGS
ncbi:Chromosome transmission fidelity protein 18 [Friedmanniomyces endolithicus]|nr:Chromosome transmission fidelity protein 18 [Friedmanniomyces endolithicus]